MSHNTHGDSDLSPLLSSEDSSSGNDALRQRRGILQRPKDFALATRSINQSISRPHLSVRDGSSQPPVAIFAVNFDAKKGNVLEWSATRNGMDLVGVEFKAFPSGAHTIPSDFTIFKFREYFGIACFETVMDVASSRGAHLKSVGLLANNLNQLTRNRTSLTKFVRQLHEQPDNFHNMEKWFDALSSSDAPDSLSPSDMTQGDFLDRNVVLAFMRRMEARLFVLWKLMMLRKRVLFVSGPPVQTLCTNVLLCALLDSTEDNRDGSSLKPSTLFFVDLHDMDAIKLAETYNACSTEKIFETKQELFDALVVDGDIRIPSRILQEQCLLTAADRRRFVDYMETVVTESKNEEIGCDSVHGVPEDARTLFVDAFASLNYSVLSCLRAASSFGEGKITAEDISALSLDATSDIPFLSALAELHGFRVEFPPVVWCPGCRCC
ncbi:putative Protein LCHN [Hypsibius exemplaris]|uniref:UDENN domain-containing protein n=1 Tax=Hypsibius exemplaris TaxID=2072580 RepID=A0A1W0WA50_HYPEX|nr:putative Protein LCHN [Hypsibius exemplaris]